MTDTLMELYETDLSDPALLVILDDHALPVGAHPFHGSTNLVLVGLEEGVPVGFVNGVYLDGHPILENMGIRPGFQAQGRSIAFFEAFEAAIRQRGQQYFLVAINLDHAEAPFLRTLLTKWGAQHYFTDQQREWWVRFVTVPVTKEEE